MSGGTEGRAKPTEIWTRLNAPHRGSAAMIHQYSGGLMCENIVAVGIKLYPLKVGL
jgi:hypothetical protein